MLERYDGGTNRQPSYELIAKGAQPGDKSRKQGAMNFFSHHKCATRWFVDYLSRFARLNSLSLFHTDFEDARRDQTANLAFFGNSNYRQVENQGLSGYHVIRNPLNIIVSAYYSHIRTHPTEGWNQLIKQRDLLRSVTKEEGMYITLTFLERQDFWHRAVGPILAMRQ